MSVEVQRIYIPGTFASPKIMFFALVVYIVVLASQKMYRELEGIISMRLTEMLRKTTAKQWARSGRILLYNTI